MALNCDNMGTYRSFSGLDKESDARFDEGLGKTELGGSALIDVADIIDRLPADPFGMNMKSTFTTITGWLQDFETDFEDLCGFDIDDCEKNNGDQDFFSGLNFVWNGSTRFQQEKDNLKIDEISFPYSSFSQYGIANGVSDGGVGCTSNLNDKVVCNYKAEEVCFDCGEGGYPHDALFFALGYLRVKDLLVVESVCRSLRDAVRSDPLLWRSIQIDQPLSEKITDDALVKLTGRAQGTLQCLSLVNCFRITHSGLERVLETNPELRKLSVPGCLKLSIEGILSNLRAFKSTGTSGIKYLRIGGLLGVTDKQFEELKCLLGVDDNMQLRTCEPQFYHWGQLHLSCDDDRAIDIETCPQCQKPGLVYDCPAESCQANDHAAQLCRGCRLCIARCICCGCCIEDCDYEETFCLDRLCLNCLKQLLICRETSEVKCASSSKHTIFCQETRYEFRFYG